MKYSDIFHPNSMPYVYTVWITEHVEYQYDIFSARGVDVILIMESAGTPLGLACHSLSRTNMSNQGSAWITLHLALRMRWLWWKFLVKQCFSDTIFRYQCPSIQQYTGKIYFLTEIRLCYVGKYSDMKLKKKRSDLTHSDKLENTCYSNIEMPFPVTTCSRQFLLLIVPIINLIFCVLVIVDQVNINQVKNHLQYNVYPYIFNHIWLFLGLCMFYSIEYDVTTRTYKCDRDMA